MGDDNRLLASNIVTRLRTVFLAIAVVLSTAMVIGTIELRKLNASVDKLTVSSVPVFIKTEETERRLKNLLLLLRRVDSIDTLSDLIPLERSVHTEVADLREDTIDLTQTGATTQMASGMTSALGEIEVDATKALQAKRQILIQTADLIIAGGDIDRSREVLHNLLGDMSYDAIAATDQTFERTRTRDEIEVGQIENLYQQNLALANTITEITLSLETVIDTALRLHSVIDIEEFQRLEVILRFKVRNIAILAGQLSQSEDRVKLAAEIGAMREILLGDDGIVNKVNSLVDLRNDLELYTMQQLKPIGDISALSDQLIEAARQRIDAAQLELKQTTTRMTYTLILAAALSLLAIGVTVIFVVEKQISRRMARLTEAVIAIADGDTNHKVDISGPDELGKMATALEVFRLNAEELRRSNVQLEKFAYVAAHDLRSPLRAIQDLIEWTLEDDDNVFTPDGRENMDLLKSRVERLDSLLSDLLEYARVGQETDDISDISVEKIVQDSAGLLDPNDMYHIRFSGYDGDVCTYVTPFRQIFLNLINNAIKHHDRPSGNIEVEAELIGDRILCTVRDDGPGIDPKHHDRIFGLFQTLRPRDEVEGSGMGLAIIHKLLEHFDTSISVQSNPSEKRGTVFTFEMPEKSQQKIVHNLAA